MSFKNLLLIILTVKAFLMTLFIIYGDIHLSPDEAQYWTWSQALDWGYYSKPPGIAWQIALGTSIFGSSEFGIRFLSIIISFAQAILVYYLALASNLQPRVAFYCSLIMAFSPIGLIGSLLATTDGGFLLFWTLACLLVLSAFQENKEPNPLWIGLTLAFGALFKWPIYLFWIVYLAIIGKYFPKQNKIKIFSGIALSLLGLIPSLYWNSQHDWATFKHVSTAIQGGNSAVIQGNFWEFLGAQVLLLSPILFGLLIFSIAKLVVRKMHESPQIVFCGLISVVFLVCSLSVSLFQKIQGNWIVFIYPTAIVLIGWYVSQNFKRIRWVNFGLGLSMILSVYFFVTPTLTLQDNPLALSFKLNPFKHNMGWNQLYAALNAVGYDPEKNFLISDKYQTTSLLSFYGPEKKRAYFLNLQESRNNQFSYWSQSHESERGRAGYFIWIENQPHLAKDINYKPTYYGKELRKYFREVTFLGFYPLIQKKNEVLKGTLIFKCVGQYRSPKTSKLF